MAKSKNGGTRAYIRGRIGSDVYSVGKNGKGERQQVVRSLAESVANPRTSLQMFGRMVMSTVMQAVSALQPIIDHSFDGVAKGQPSISEFIRRNYALIKADATANPSADNSYGLNQYQEKGIKLGAYIVSNGNVGRNSNVDAATGVLTIYVGDESPKVSDFLASTGVGADGFVTLVLVKSNGQALYARIGLKSGVSADTAITSESLDSVFNVESNGTPTLSLADGILTVSAGAAGASYAADYILSKKESGSFVHSTATLVVVGDPAYTADVALPTYPTGSEMFLNGGDL